MVRPWPPRLHAGVSAACLPVFPGLIEGFKVEKANLQEALGQKEAAERGLVVQLEGQSQQLQQAARQQAELREQNAVLRLQAEAAEAAATAAQQREAGRRRLPAGRGREPSCAPRFLHLRGVGVTSA